MKKLLITILSLAAVFATGVRASAELTVGNADLTITEKHPRILATDKDFKEYRAFVKSDKNHYLTRLHGEYMEYADACVKGNKTFTYSPNAAGKLLGVSRDVLHEILACSYAFRFTGNKDYLLRAEKILSDVCSFETWHPKHYLDVAEMSTAVGLAYDWLYNKMDKNVRETARVALNKLGLDPAEDGSFRKRFKSANNWGQVLNAGLIVNAMAVYEDNPERAKALIKRAVEDNYEKMPLYYTEDGIYPEGGGYWNYGTMFQLLAVQSLLKTYGTDFGLTDFPGWRKTANFMISIPGPTGKNYNFSDGSEGKAHLINQLWFFANNVNGTEILYPNFAILDSDDKVSFNERLGAIYLFELAKVNLSAVKEPMKVFSGRGKTPLVLARTGWSGKSLFLGAKGGTARANHAHMDVGSFVYDAYGVRWAREPQTDGYTVHEVNMHKKNSQKSFWSMSQESWRWECPGYNNKEHSTLTVNGHNHLVDAFVTMDEVFDSPQAKGARFNLTPVFGKDLTKAERTIVIRDDSYLEITDVLAAPERQDAQIRWTWCSPVDAEFGVEGASFKSGKVRMLLATDAPEAKFQKWSTNPADYPDNPTSSYLKHEPRKETFLTGFTFTVPAGKEITVVTTFKKIEK